VTDLTDQEWTKDVLTREHENCEGRPVSFLRHNAMPIKGLLSTMRYLMPLVFALLPGVSNAEDWPQFRGPGGCGVTTRDNLPLEWNAKSGKNIRWSVDAEGQGTSSPIVWEDRVYIANVAANPDGEQPLHHVQCFQLSDGKRLWKTAVEPGPAKRGPLKGDRGLGYANSTPCTDGERVYALFGSSVLVAIDSAGKLKWHYELKPFHYNFEMATSPILYQDLVIVFCGLNKEPRLIAFKKQTGDIVYDHRLKDTGYGHSTPVLAPGKIGTQMLIAASSKEPANNALQAFDPLTGKKLWWAAGVASTATPVLAGDRVYFDSGRGGLATLVALPTGDAASPVPSKWTANVPESLGSPVIVGEHIYRLHNNGILTCRSLKTGEKVYQERVGASSAWASPVADAKGRIYLASAGKSVVVQAGAEFMVLANNDLGDPGHASPAVADGRLLLLGQSKLWCIGEK
jgi:outer membrane protein assembly factor BamB